MTHIKSHQELLQELYEAIVADSKELGIYPPRSNTWKEVLWNTKSTLELYRGVIDELTLRANSATTGEFCHDATRLIEAVRKLRESRKPAPRWRREGARLFGPDGLEIIVALILPCDIYTKPGIVLPNHEDLAEKLLPHLNQHGLS